MAHFVSSVSNVILLATPVTAPSRFSFLTRVANVITLPFVGRSKGTCNVRNLIFLPFLFYLSFPSLRFIYVAKFSLEFPFLFYTHTHTHTKHTHARARTHVYTRILVTPCGWQKASFNCTRATVNSCVIRQYCASSVSLNKEFRFKLPAQKYYYYCFLIREQLSHSFNSDSLL